MADIYFGANNWLTRVSEQGADWDIHVHSLADVRMQCLDIDRYRSKRLYVGTFDHGLFTSDDHGKSWQRAGEGIGETRITAVRVSPTEHDGEHSVVWVGTEPSRLYRSEDGGHSWTEFPALLDLPSRPTWRFPPRPHTHHVRWIEPDPHEADRLFVGIELGGVMRSLDRGYTWEDRKPGSEHDCHTLATHPLTPGLIVEAAGGGYAESRDGGNTWSTFKRGLNDYSYLVDIAVDSGNPDVTIASASPSPRQAYNAKQADTVIVRRTGTSDWEHIHTGLAPSTGTTVSALQAHPHKHGTFFAVNNRGLYESTDSGRTWRQLPLDWPEELTSLRIQGITIDV